MRKGFNEVQNDASEKACYCTFELDHSKKFGFVCMSVYDDFVSLMSFDSPEDWADLTGDRAAYGKYLTWLRVGDATTLEGVKYIRLW